MNEGSLPNYVQTLKLRRTIRSRLTGTHHINHVLAKHVAKMNDRMFYLSEQTNNVEFC